MISKAQTDSLRIKNRIDSLLSKTSVDTVLLKLALPDSLAGTLSKIDSTAQSTVTNINKISNSINQPIDKVNQSAAKLTSLPSMITDKSILLQKKIVTQPPNIKGLDSLRHGLDSIETKLNKIQPEISKINSPQWVKAAEQKKDNTVSAVNSKLKAFKNKGATGLPGEVNLPATPSIDQSALPDLKNKKLPLPDVAVNKSGAKLPSSEGVGKKIKLHRTKTPKLKEIKGLDQAGNIQEKLGEVTSVAGKASSYQEDLKNLGDGNFERMEQLPDELEKRVANLDDMKALEGQAGTYKAVIAKWNSDPDVQKEAALNLAKEQAVNHFAGKEEQLKAAMEQLAKLKAKTKGAEGVVDLFKKHQNTMKQKTFLERLVPGIVFQVQKPNNVWIDFNPSLGYRFYGRLTAGLGWNERWSLSFKERHSYSTEHIYGPRSFIEFKWKDYLFLKAETEWMNILPVSIYPAYIVDTSGRRWVWSSFAGIKNVFTFSKSVKGQVQVLYNLYNPDKLSPYSNRLNVRFGFDFPIKKKGKNPITKS